MKGIHNEVKKSFSSPEKGIDGISRKEYDGNTSQEHSNRRDEAQTFSIPEAEVIDPKELNSAKSLNKLKRRNSNSSPMALNLPAGASTQDRYMAIMMRQAGQCRFDMDECLEEISERNEQNYTLAEQIKYESQQAADLRKDAASEECFANKQSAMGQCSITIGGIIGTAAGLPCFAAVAAAVPVVAAVGAGIGAAYMFRSAQHKWQAASLTCESDIMQAEIQLKKDEQNTNNTKISVFQNLFSTASQAYNTAISIWQSMIASENEARRTIASNIR
ncbi:MAG: hypothetical protein LBJ75_02415 [Puniceicoccales bacterium]|nr:hypothetical protein [Puniceicoccales bacterium]